MAPLIIGVGRIAQKYYTGVNMVIAITQMSVVAVGAVASLAINGCGAARNDACIPGDINPRVFEPFACWISDNKQPVYTEVSLDAIKNNGNQYGCDHLIMMNDYITVAREDGGYIGYRIISSDSKHLEIQYIDNGGGSLTRSVYMKFKLAIRSIAVDGKNESVSCLMITSIDEGSVRRVDSVGVATHD